MAYSGIVLAAALLLINSAFGFDQLCVDQHWAAGIHPHPTDCSKFIECNNGVAYEMYCPATLAFNPTIKSCDNPNNFQCNVKSTARPTHTNAPTANFDHLCYNNGWVSGTLHPHPTECHKFIECVEGRGVEMVCPVDLAYNPAKLYCDDPVKMGCTTYITRGPGAGVDVTVAPGVTFLHYCDDHKFSDSSLHPHPTDCHRYIECSNGLAYVMTCPAGLAFNDAIDSCASANNVNCGTAIKPATRAPTGTVTGSGTGTGTSGDINNICRDQNLVDGIHPHPYECHRFIECAKLRTFIMDCPVGEVYNAQIKTCQLIADAPACQTNTGVKPSGSSAQTVCQYYKLADGIHPHPSRCDQFIECSNGKSYTLSCPTGLHYHSVEKTCDDVHKVTCSDNFDFFHNLVVG